MDSALNNYPPDKPRAWMRDHSWVTLSTKMAENSEPAKRARKPNFTAAECTLLLAVAEENKYYKKQIHKRYNEQKQK